LINGIRKEALIYYGLEYRFITLYLAGEMKYDVMVKNLEVAIHRFAKRQMTWFRGMERKGIVIHWINSELPMNEKVGRVMELLKG
jgi:tRNA dimethylallyltransferase